MKSVNELKAIEMLRESLKSRGYSEDYVLSQIAFLFDVDGGFETRFDFFMPYITREDKEFMLVSGSSVGSELILAIKHGFRNVVGTEVSDYYIPIANIMTEGIKAETLLYDGMKLPFESDRFSMIQSCHIIEHTKDPLEYLKEHIRALKSGGLFFIEFPDRYYSTELHTGTKSFEKYPEVIRNTVLTLLSKVHLSLQIIKGGICRSKRLFSKSRLRISKNG